MLSTDPAAVRPSRPSDFRPARFPDRTPDGAATRPVAAQDLPDLVVRTVEVEQIDDLLALLPTADPASTFSWVRRGEGLVGWGTALRVETSGPDRIGDADTWWSRAVARMAVHDDVRLPGTGPVAFGSFSFAPESTSGGVLVLPAVVIGTHEGRSWITTALPASAALDENDAVDAVATMPSPTPVTGPGHVSFRDGALTAEEWTAAVAAVIERIRAGDVSKVVLARDVVATAERPMDVRHLLGRLSGDYPGCWTFAVDRLVGATPELLVRREKGLAASRVLAGTIQRTGDDAADLRRAAELARSSKDLEEHDFAVASLVRALRPFCASINVPDAPFVLHLPNVMHLASDVTGVVDGSWHASGDGAHHAGDPSPSSLRLAAALHPTAAVGGTPTTDATAILAEAEQMDRGRYAGPVGWIGADGDGEWGIGLRSGELSAANARELRIFAGCGLVAASDPESELAETEAKLRPMRDALRG